MLLPMKEAKKKKMMIKKIYGLAWLGLIALAAVAVATGSFNELAVLAFGLVALGLVHALAVWSVIVNTETPGTT